MICLITLRTSAGNATEASRRRISIITRNRDFAVHAGIPGGMQ